MNDLAIIAYHHTHGFGVSWTDWLAHVTISSLFHALVYGFVGKLMRQMSLGEAALLVVVVLAGLFVWARSRDRRGW